MCSKGKTTYLEDLFLFFFLIFKFILVSFTSMNKSLGYIIYDFQALLMFISFIVSLRLINNKKIPEYMQGFYWYPIIGIVVLIPHFLAFHFFKKLYFVSIPINNISLLFHFSFLAFFIIQVIPNKKFFFLKVLFFIFFSLIIYFLTTKPLKDYNSSAFAVANLGLVIFCIIYYYQLFNNIPILNLRNEASFWVITGVFFCMSINIPINSIIDYLWGKIPYSYLSFFTSVGVLCYSIMHLFFIKACLCSLRLLKS